MKLCMLWNHAEFKCICAKGSLKSVHGKEEESELRIAWQYRKYIQNQNGQQNQQVKSVPLTSGSGSRNAVEAGISREWCRAYDLTKSMGDVLPIKHGMVRVFLH